MDAASPSPPVRLAHSYEETILTLTETEARLVLGLAPDDFWSWYEGRSRSDTAAAGDLPGGARR